MTDQPNNVFQHRYLRVQDLRRLRHYFFSSRRPVEGLYAGRHSSLQRGHSVEFSDYRSYMPGDEIADIDWKVYGRSDRLYVKLFEHQTDLTVSILVDGSASMGYFGEPRPARTSLLRRAPAPTTPDRKYDAACRLAAAVAFLIISQQDRVGLGVAQAGLQSMHRPGGSFPHLHRLLNVMEQAQPTGRADLPEAIHQFAAGAGRRGLLILISDLLDDRDAIMQALSRFTHQHNEVIVFHVLHADELDLPNWAEAQFVDSESGARVRLNVRDVRREYARRMRGFLDGWSAAFKTRGMDYNLVNTAEPYTRTLENYLFARAAIM